MPEGDTVYRSARSLDRALAGRTVTGFDLRVPRFATSDLTGDTIHNVASRGKHLLHRIGTHTLHSHLKMEGEWHLYHPGTAWKRPNFQARAIIETDEWVAVGFDLGIVELLETRDEDEAVGYLGPDLLGADWNAAEARARLAAEPERPSAVALLDQRNLAGIGNEYANEICFIRGILPTRPIGETDIAAAVELSYRLLHANRDRPRRITTGNQRPGQETWVYGRKGRPCRRCGTPIRKGELGATELEMRVTYWCPRCQT